MFGIEYENPNQKDLKVGDEVTFDPYHFMSTIVEPYKSRGVILEINKIEQTYKDDEGFVISEGTLIATVKVLVASETCDKFPVDSTYETHICWLFRDQDLKKEDLIDLADKILILLNRYKINNFFRKGEYRNPNVSTWTYNLDEPEEEN